MDGLDKIFDDPDDEEEELPEKSAIVYDLVQLYRDNFNVPREINPIEGEDYIQLAHGVLAFLDNEYQDAIEALEPLTPGRALISLIVGRSYVALDKERAALNMFNRGLLIQPDNVELILDKISTLLALGKDDQARRALERRFDDPKKDAQIIHKRAEMHYQREEYDQCLVHVNEALSLDPDSLDALTLRAYAHRDRGDYEQALEYFTKLIDVSPDAASLLIVRANIYFENGEDENAFQDIEYAYHLEPDDVDILQLYASTVAQQGNRTEAIRLYRDALEFRPDNELIRLELAELVMEGYKCGEVINLLAPVTTEEYHDPQAFVLRGFAYEFLGNREAAMSHYDAALQRDPSNIIAQQHRDLCERDYKNELLEDEIRKLELAERSERM